MAGATQVSLKGAGQILAEEGLVLGGYLDSQNVWTIGVGHTAMAGGVNPADYAKKKMSKRDAMLLFLSTDLPRYAADVLRAVKVPLAQHELDALASFHYNTGAIARAGITKKLNAGDRAGAAAAFDQWVKPPEIIGRRMNEKHLFQTGQYRNSGYVAVFPGGAGGARGKAKPESIASLLALVSGGEESGAAEPVQEPTVTFKPPLPQDEPQPEAAPVLVPPSSPAIVSGFDPRVQAAQRELIRVGLKLEPDGRMGPATIGAMSTFRATFGLVGIANQVDAALEAKLAETKDGYFQPAPERAQATPEQAAAKSETVEKVTFSAWVRRKISDIAVALGIGGVVDSQTDILGIVSGRTTGLLSKLGMVPWFVWVIAALALYILYREYARRTTEAVVVQAFKAGDIIGGDKHIPPVF